jgi:hypothetical protein
MLLYIAINPKLPEDTFEFDKLRTIDIKCYLEEYIGIEVQIKVIDLDFWILSIQSDSPMLLPIFYYKL